MEHALLVGVWQRCVVVPSAACIMAGLCCWWCVREGMWSIFDCTGAMNLEPPV
jgi:hypothetical protein